MMTFLAARIRATEADRHSERGSIVIASSAVMLLLLVGVALIAQSRVTLDAVATETDTAIADAFADQGVAEVLALIENGQRGSFSNSRQTGLGGYRYEVEQADDETFLVRVDGESDGVTRSIEVTIGGQDGYTLGVVDRATIVGNLGTIAGRVVTNGTIDATGTPVGDRVDLYGPDATCSGCAAGVSFADPLDVAYPTRPVGTTRRCPLFGSFVGVLDGQAGVPYVCRRSEMFTGRVRFSGAVAVVNPPLIVYIEPGLDVAFVDAAVNTLGAAEDFQLIGVGDDNYWWFDSWNSTVNGVLYAPGRDSWLSSSNITGQVTVGVLYIEAPNHVWVGPSPELLELSQSTWYVSTFERVSSR